MASYSSGKDKRINSPFAFWNPHLLNSLSRGQSSFSNFKSDQKGVNNWSNCLERHWENLLLSPCNLLLESAARLSNGRYIQPLVRYQWLLELWIHYASVAQPSTNSYLVFLHPSEPALGVLMLVSLKKFPSSSPLGKILWKNVLAASRVL